MHLTIHRGTHQIGGSCIELSVENSRIVLDLGLPLPRPGGGGERIDEETSAPELVARGVLPKIPGLYAHDVPSVEAVLVTHAHGDHAGLLSFIHPDIPVYASEGTQAILDVNRVFLPWTRPAEGLRILPKGRSLKISSFTVTAMLVDHSAPDALALLVEAGGKRVLYSGDLRAHGRKGKLFERMVASPPRDVDALLLEGTMMGRSGPQEVPDETGVENALVEVLRDLTNVTFFFCSGQNVDRVVSAYRAVLKTDSIMVIDLYTAWVLARLAPLSSRLPQFSWKNVRVKYWMNHAKRLAEAGHQKFLYEVNPRKIEVAEIAEKRDRILFLARANAVFPRALKDVKDLTGLRLIWSMWPGYLTPDNPVRRFAEEHGLAIETIHTSGHATVEDLKRLVEAVSPRTVVPIHTEQPGRYPELFPDVRQLDDGEDLVL